MRLDPPPLELALRGAVTPVKGRVSGFSHPADAAAAPWRSREQLRTRVFISRLCRQERTWGAPGVRRPLI